MMRLWFRISLYFVVLILLSLSQSVAMAQSDPNWVPLDAEAMISDCWEEPNRRIEGGSTADMRAAALDAAFCIEARIVEQLEAFLDPDSLYVQERMPDYQKHIRSIGNGIAELFWALHNNNKYCGGFQYCGTMEHVKHNGALAHYYGVLLKDIVSKRNFVER